jgi:two-component system sensor histidine kinase DegS
VKRMLGILSLKTKVKISTSPHFWAIIVITLFLLFIYQAWPWREWKFTDGVWQWFPWLSSLYKLAIVEFRNHLVGILFFVPIIYALVFFGWRGALAISLLSLGGVLPIIVDMWTINSIITNIVLLLLPLLVISLATFELKWRRKERRIFAEREEERKTYISKILEAQENERRRIAQELHDETIQTLLTIANSAENLLSSDHDNMREVRGNAEFIKDITLNTVENLRRISLDLRPSVLDNLGLIPALRWLVDQTNKDSDVDTQIRVAGIERNLPPQTEAAVFRVVQEALNNIKRHSKATKAMVELEFTNSCLKIKIQDNGQGFRPPRQLHALADKGQIGLIGIQQRIDSIGGTFQVRSKPGEGTLLLIEVQC